MPYLTEAEASALLKITRPPDLLRRLLEDGVPVVYVSPRRWRVHEPLLLEWAATRAAEPARRSLRRQVLRQDLVRRRRS